LRRLLGASDVDVAIAALPLAVKFDPDGALAKPIEELGAKLGQQLRDRNVPVATRARALRALFGMPARRAEAIAAAETLFGPSESPELRAAAIDELGRAGDDASGAALARAFGALSGAAREQALSKLVARANSANALLAEVEAGRVKPTEIGTRGVSALRNHSDANVSKRANAAFDRLQGVAPNIEALIAKLEPEVSKPGDVARGAAVFKTNCGNCHTFRNEGGKVGPDLTGIGTHGVHELLPIVLDPNRTVEAAYLEYVAETKDELIVTGVLVRDTQQSIVLRSATGDVEVPRDDLASLKSTGRSPMPAGFETIGADGLRDLFTFLASGFEGYRMIDLRTLVNASTRLGMYDTRRDANPMELVTWGPQEIAGIPFDVLDPAKRADGKNVVVLRGGRGKDWESKSQPQRVEVPLGALVKSVHVLGGIAAWGHPCTTDKRPIAKWTWKYADGSSEEVVLRDGIEFADWIGRRDVPGSKYCAGVVKPDSAGQVRTFELVPKKPVPIASIVLESFDDDRAPTWVALTAELPGARKREAKAAAIPAADVLLAGGGSSHDFARFFGGTDVETLKASGARSIRYTEALSELAPALASAKALVLSTNQPFDDEARHALTQYLERGGALVALHPATWVNASDWTDYNARFIGGGAKSHENYGEFEVRVVDPAHALAAGVPPTFRVKDELYRFERRESDARIHVIAVGRSLASGAEFPVAWTVERARGRTACITLGHDGAAHEHAAFRALLANAVRWARENE
jgi:putative heme-binding domain-containing protein